MLLRTLLFVVPGAALGALLPLVASRLLGLDAFGYGVLLGALGLGAVAGATVLPRVVALLSPTRLVLVAGTVFGAAILACAYAPNLAVAVLALVPAGLAWLCMLATMNGALRARTVSGAGGVSSSAWGAVGWPSRKDAALPSLGSRA